MSSSASVTVNATRFTGIYFGPFGPTSGDRFAIVIRPDGTALFLGYSSSQSTGYAATSFTVNPDGSFTATLTEIKPTSGSSAQNGGNLKQSASAPLMLTGTVTGTNLSGSVTGAPITLSALKSASSGAAQAAAGVYQTAGLNSSGTQLTTIVDATGQAFVFVQTPSGAAAAAGSLDPATGKVAVTLTDSSTVTATVNTASGSAEAKLTNGKSETAFSGVAEGVVRTDRLVNISSRGPVTGADLMIAGFVVAGTEPKSVLIRATGPALTTFGLGGALPNPKLELYSGQTKIQENDDWSSASNASEVAATAERTGAFALAAGSKDAALLATLAPGSYTAQVSTTDGAAGVSLVEVYDAGQGPVGDATPRIINISTRAVVNGGEGILIAGVVITGNAPKQVLIRATGPALAGFGVGNALADPRVKLFKGETLIRENDNWSDSATDAPLIAAAGVATGAFALAPGSKDAALLLTLEPGSYTVQVSGSGNRTGVSLVEVYEVNR
jgi:hypothetical protein